MSSFTNSKHGLILHQLIALLRVYSKKAHNECNDCVNNTSSKNMNHWSMCLFKNNNPITIGNISENVTNIS